MKILYAIQGTGNGHISRALEIIPILKKKGDVDILVSASQWDLEFPFEIKYKLNGLGFAFGKKGGIDFTKTYLNLDTKRLLQEIKSLPIAQYDIIISDFEPVSCWAAKLKNKVCIGLSNQASALHPKAAQPKFSDPVGKLILRKYAPVTHSYGFHFISFDETVATPIIRKAVRNAEIKTLNHITVYLPSYDDKYIIDKLKYTSTIPFQIFSKHTKIAYKKGNFTVFPLKNETFIESMATCRGVITNAGFGTTSEALFLKKKLLVIPMKNQFEQHCNAAVLKSMGVTVLKSLKKKNLVSLTEWIENGKAIKVTYQDKTELLIDNILTKHANEKICLDTHRDLGFLRKLIAGEKLETV
ncbi:MAG: glycosyltransferase family protein [Bacteroidota bacterium]